MLSSCSSDPLDAARYVAIATMAVEPQGQVFPFAFSEQIPRINPSTNHGIRDSTTSEQAIKLRGSPYI